MLQFLKFTLATLVGIIIFLFLSFGILFLLIPDDSVRIQSGSVLKINLNKPILERDVDNPFEDSNLPFATTGGGIGLLELRDAIQKAKEDEKIKGIYLEISSAMAGYATLEEVRNALLDFKSSKKFVYVYGEIMTEGAYYLASVADKIFLNPDGGVEMNGLTVSLSFLKGMFEKLEIKPEVFRVGEFKSAVEPFILDKMSDSNRAQITSFLNSIYDHYLEKVSKARNIPLVELKDISQKALVQDANDALKYKLVTHLAYYDEVEKVIREALKIKEKEKIKLVELGDYKKTKDKRKKSISENKIAVIFGSGTIQSGKGDDETIGSETIASEIRKARLDDKVKAIVLRINSPGGSKLASDVMWREIVLATQKKPVIASMSDVAASGGYYMAMGCTKIVAQPNTITGSIGIFGILFNAENFYKNKLGITSDRVSTGNFPDFNSALMDRSLTEEEKKMIQTSLEKGYNDFTAKAAKGRKMDVEKLKSLASGRVWSGKEAKENGLVDVLGSFEDAVQLAAKEAKLKEGDYRLRYLPVQKTFFEKIMQGFQTNTPDYLLKEKMGELYPYLKVMNQIEKSDVIQARMPDLVIR